MTSHSMTLQEIIGDIHAMNQDCRGFEHRYGVLSETFYDSYMQGEEPEKDEWVTDWADWAGAYKILLRRHEQYQHAIEMIRQQTLMLAQIIERNAHREPVFVLDNYDDLQAEPNQSNEPTQG